MPQHEPSPDDLITFTRAEIVEIQMMLAMRDPVIQRLQRKLDPPVKPS